MGKIDYVEGQNDDDDDDDDDVVVVGDDEYELVRNDND